MFQMKLNGSERGMLDDACFLVGGRVEDIWRSLTFFLNGIIYFLLHQLVQHDILYKKLLTYLC